MSDRRLEHLFERFRVRSDVDALGQVFDATAPALRRVARHLTRDAAEAEDLVQATFLAAIERRATFDATRELNAWLTGILLKQASLVRRARGRAIEPHRMAERSVEDPLDAAAASELSEALTSALARLSPSDRDVLTPLLLDGRRAVEIARELGRRPDTIHMRIHRGLARLRQLLPAGISLGVFAKLAGARGLGAVRAEVLRGVSVQVQGASAATVGVLTVGIAMSMKKIAVVVALALVLGIGGYRVATSTEVELGARPASIGSDVGAIANVDVRQAPGDRAGRVVVTSTLDEPFASAMVEQELVFDIVRADGGVAGSVPVALVGADGKCANRLTDENGRCAFALGKPGGLASSAVSGHLYVRDHAAFPQRFAIELIAERRTIELSRGTEFSGRIVMKGDVPLPRIELQLTADSAPPGLAGASLRVFRGLELLRWSDPDMDPPVFACTTPSADGAFRFRVPDAEWSGILRLPSELVFVDGPIPSRSSERVILRAATGFEATIAYRPRIIGRLVDEATRAPLADATFQCDLIWSDGNAMGTAGVTDTDGRFTVALDYRTDASELMIDRISTRDGRTAHVAQPSKWKGTCEPFDAGDIECVFPASRSIAFRTFDSSGAPLPQACASIRNVPTAQANQHGVGTLFGVPFDATEMRVAARGHAITTVAITADTVSPLDVVLAPTNRLTIALPSEAAGRKDLYVELVSRQLLFGGTSRMYDWTLRGGMIGSCLSADGDSGTKEGAVRLGFSTDGRIEVEDIATGVPFRVRLAGWEFRGAPAGAMAEVSIDSLGPDEHRRIDLVLAPGAARAMRVLRGRATDESGRPIHRAGVEIEIGPSITGTRTEMDGTFRYDLSNQLTVDVNVTKRGYIPFRVKAWDLTSDRSLDATLRRGRDVRVELVDDQGRTIQGAHVDADIEGFGRPWKIEEGATGVFVLCDVPPGRADFTIRIAERDYLRTYDGVDDVVRLVMPAHGRLELQWRIDEVAVPGRSFQVALRPLDPDVLPQFEWTPHVQRDEGHVFEALLPGEYTVVLESGSARSSNGEIVYAPLGEPRRVTIVAGSTERVVL